MTLLLAALLVLAAEPSAAEHAMTFVAFQDGNARDGYYLVAAGTITADTPRAFERRLAEIDNPGQLTWMMLDSGGGDVLAALELGRLVRRRNLRTMVGGLRCLDGAEMERCSPSNGEFVDGRCESACAYAFLGGMERKLDLLDQPGEDDGFLAPNERRLGFHQFYSELPMLGDPGSPAREALGVMNSAQSQHTSGAIARYVEEMGVSAELLQQAASARPDAMVYPSRADLTRMRVLFHEQYLPVRLQPDGGGVSAVSPFSSGGSWTRQVGFYCGVHGDGLPATPRLIFSRAKVVEGPIWHTLGQVSVPTTVAGIAALPGRRGDDEPAWELAVDTTVPEWQRAPPREHVWGADLTAGTRRERLPGRDIRIFADANWTHLMMWPSPDFMRALASSSQFTLHFDSANVYDLMHDAVLTLDEGQRQAIAAATRSCEQPPP